MVAERERRVGEDENTGWRVKEGGKRRKYELKREKEG